ncbi:MAG: hypothetical protein F4X65_12905 [Chloroflexi bacterium]|nr:hypothetical protein [Chloroflexota bacterium]
MLELLIRRQNQVVMVRESQAWHSVKQPVFHYSKECTEGNNIEGKYRKEGKGGKRPCRRCREIVGLEVF